MAKKIDLLSDIVPNTQNNADLGQINFLSNEINLLGNPPPAPANSSPPSPGIAATKNILITPGLGTHQNNGLSQIDFKFGYRIQGTIVPDEQDHRVSLYPWVDASSRPILYLGGKAGAGSTLFAPYNDSSSSTVSVPFIYFSPFEYKIYSYYFEGSFFNNLNLQRNQTGWEITGGFATTSTLILKNGGDVAFTAPGVSKTADLVTPTLVGVNTYKLNLTLNSATMTAKGVMYQSDIQSGITSVTNAGLANSILIIDPATSLPTFGQLSLSTNSIVGILTVLNGGSGVDGSAFNNLGLIWYDNTTKTFKTNSGFALNSSTPTALGINTGQFYSVSSAEGGVQIWGNVGIGSVGDTTGQYNRLALYAASGAASTDLYWGNQRLLTSSAGSAVTNIIGTALQIQVTSIGPGVFQIGLTNNINITGIATADIFNATTALRTNGTTRIDSSGNLSNIGTISALGNLTLTGAGASIIFTNTGNHDILATGGTLRLGAISLTGAIEGGGQAYTNAGNVTAATTANILQGFGTIIVNSAGLPLANLDVTGTAAVTSLKSGFVKGNTLGFLTTELISLSADVTGTLPVNRGGTGAVTFTGNGVLYGNNTSTIQATAVGTTGQVLIANSTATPVFSYTIGGAGQTITVGGDLIVVSDLYVNGTATIFNVDTLTIEDSLIGLATNNTANTIDSGFFAGYVVGGGNTQYAGIIKRNNTGDFYVFSGINTYPTTTVSNATTNTANLYANMHVASLAGGATTGFAAILTGVGHTGLYISGQSGIIEFNGTGRHQIRSSGISTISLMPGSGKVGINTFVALNTLDINGGIRISNLASGATGVSLVETGQFGDLSVVASTQYAVLVGEVDGGWGEAIPGTNTVLTHESVTAFTKLNLSTMVGGILTSLNGGTGLNAVGVANSILASTGTGYAFTGKLILPWNTALNPTIAFDGDTDTGIFHPAANQVAITANGSQILTVTSTSVGINSATPFYNLDLSTGNFGFGGTFFTTSRYQFRHRTGGATTAEFDSVNIGYAFETNVPQNGLYVSGNTGIGTSAIAYGFDVWKSAYFNNGLTVNGITTSSQIHRGSNPVVYSLTALNSTNGIGVNSTLYSAVNLSGVGVTYAFNYTTNTLTLYAGAGGGGGNISGSGTPNYITKFDGATSIADSIIQEISGDIQIAPATPSTQLFIGTSLGQGAINLTNIGTSGAIYWGNGSIIYSSSANSIVTDSKFAVGAGFTVYATGFTSIKPMSGEPALQISAGAGATSGSLLFTILDSSGTVVSSIDASGNLKAFTKSFDIIHPTKQGKRLVYGVLEGPEYGVYHRGTATGKSKVKVELPSYWKYLVDSDFTITITSKNSKSLYISEQTLDYFVVSSVFNIFNIRKPIIFDYYVVGSRKDAKLQIEQ